MSDLVEKVGDIIAARIAACEPCDDIARAAIAVVLGHLADNVSDEMVFTSFRAGGIQVLSEHPEVIDKRRREISAALRAAAGPALEAKP